MLPRLLSQPFSTVLATILTTVLTTVLILFQQTFSKLFSSRSRNHSHTVPATIFTRLHYRYHTVLATIITTVPALARGAARAVPVRAVHPEGRADAGGVRQYRRGLGIRCPQQLSGERPRVRVVIGEHGEGIGRETHATRAGGEPPTPEG